MMRRANKYLTDKAKRMLYYGQVHSNLSYGHLHMGTYAQEGPITRALSYST